MIQNLSIQRLQINFQFLIIQTTVSFALLIAYLTLATMYQVKTEWQMHGNPWRYASLSGFKNSVMSSFDTDFKVHDFFKICIVRTVPRNYLALVH